MPTSPCTAPDGRLRRLTLTTARLDLLWTGARWSEGPAYFAAGR